MAGHSVGSGRDPEEAEILKEAMAIHAHECDCECDDDYLISCPNMVAAILEVGKKRKDRPLEPGGKSDSINCWKCKGYDFPEHVDGCPVKDAEPPKPRWRCGKCEGADLPLHSRHCPKRGTEGETEGREPRDKWEAYLADPNRPIIAPMLEAKLRGVELGLVHRVLLEMSISDRRWGPQFHDDDRWLSILTEEVGEVAKALNDKEDAAAIEAELIQVASVALNFIWHRRRRDDVRYRRVEPGIRTVKRGEPVNPFPPASNRRPTPTAPVSVQVNLDRASRLPGTEAPIPTVNLSGMLDRLFGRRPSGA